MISSLFPEITYIHEKRKGVSIARNLGIKNCHSTWIAFLDSDDAWEPQKLEKQLFFQIIKKNIGLFILMKFGIKIINFKIN